MKQEQLIAYSLILFIVIPLIITTLGGMMILKGAAEFFPYAKFLFGLTVSLSLLLFTLKNFKILYGWMFTLVISLFHTVTLRHSFLFNEINLFFDFIILLAFFSCILLCIRYIFLNKVLRSVRTLTFALVGAFIFTVFFVILLLLSGHHVYGFRMIFSDFSMGFMLFAIIGIGFLLTDMVLNAIANHYHLNPDFLTVNPPNEKDAEESDVDKDSDD
jgi:hypothetical protein